MIKRPGRDKDQDCSFFAPYVLMVHAGTKLPLTLPPFWKRCRFFVIQNRHSVLHDEPSQGFVVLMQARLNAGILCHGKITFVSADCIFGVKTDLLSNMTTNHNTKYAQKFIPTLQEAQCVSIIQPQI
jgi:hypothetical protein